MVRGSDRPLPPAPPGSVADPPPARLAPGWRPRPPAARARALDPAGFATLHRPPFFLGLTPAQTRAKGFAPSGLPPLRCAGLTSGSLRSRSLRSSLAPNPRLSRTDPRRHRRGADNGASPAGRSSPVTPPEQASNSGTPQGAAEQRTHTVPGDHDGRPSLLSAWCLLSTAVGSC